MWELTTKAIKIFRAQGYGRIINHSSVLGLVSLKFRGAYNASKYAIEALDDTLRLELAGMWILKTLFGKRSMKPNLLKPKSPQLPLFQERAVLLYPTSATL